MRDALGCLAACVGIGIIAFAVFSIGWWHGRDYYRNQMRKDAIEAGVAEWRVDPKTGATEFVFKGATK